MNFNTILDWLRRNNFIVDHSEYFHPEYVFCKKMHINIVLKKIDQSYDLKQIRSESVDLRSKMSSLGINIWNTYFLICTDDKFEISYSIEKDAVGIRKYVINNEKDFQRIPFLDLHNHSFAKKSIIEEVNLESSDYTLNNLVENILINNGFHQMLEKNEISRILEEIYNIKVDENEN